MDDKRFRVGSTRVSTRRSVSTESNGPAFVVREGDPASPVFSAERLVALSKMVGASAADEDTDRLAIVAHRYISALVDHLTAWGRSVCDGPDGLLWAETQLALLVLSRRVIESATVGAAATKPAENLAELTERYAGLVRQHVSSPCGHGES